jgi:hypothetical protein
MVVALDGRRYPVESVLQQLLSQPSARAFFVDYLSNAVPGAVMKPPARVGKEQYDDEARLRRMQVYMNLGNVPNRAAMLACIDDPAGASDDACRARLIRKFKERLET